MSKIGFVQSTCALCRSGGKFIAFDAASFRTAGKMMGKLGWFVNLVSDRRCFGPSPQMLSVADLTPKFYV